jgi:hypothetical protein
MKINILQIRKSRIISVKNAASNKQKRGYETIKNIGEPISINGTKQIQNCIGGIKLELE